MNNKNESNAKSWSDKMSVDADQDKALAGIPEKVRSMKIRDRKERQLPPRSTTETPPRNEPMYSLDGFSGLMPEHQLRVQNFDFQVFPTLCQDVFMELEGINPRLRRELPFCVFQHAMTETLTTHLITMVKQQNHECRFEGENNPRDIIGADDIIIPKPIHDYIHSVGLTTTSTGDLVYSNLPLAGVPREKEVVAAAQNQAAYTLEGGSFGPITADNHNAYECYVSPFITRKLIEQTSDRNNAGRDWNPFPAETFPAGAQPTPNLLGYRKPEHLQNEGLQKVQDCVFTEAEFGTESRLAHCPEVISRNNVVLNGLEGKFPMKKGLDMPATTMLNIGFLKPPGTLSSTVSISSAGVSVYASDALSVSQTCKTYLYGHKFERTVNTPGYSMLIAGVAIAGWQATINSNHHMVGEFAPTFGNDLQRLRSGDFSSCTTGSDRRVVTKNWITKTYKTTGPKRPG